MAEFCLECLNELMETEYPANKFIMSKDTELCEGCGQYKRIVIVERVPFSRRILKIIKLLGRIIILPYLIYKNYKNFKK